MSTTLINIEALLKPIDGPNPSGEDLFNASTDRVFDEIEEARLEEDDSLNQGDWIHEVKVADWNKVVSLASKTLAEKSKDLRLAVWLCEGMIKLKGSNALIDSIKLVRLLLEGFWESCYPIIEEDDFESRAVSIGLFDRTLTKLIKTIAITQSTKGDNFTFSLWHKAFQGITIDAKAEGAKAVLEERKKLADDWKTAKDHTSNNFFESIHSLISDSLAELTLLERCLSDKFPPNERPGVSNLRTTLESILNILNSVLKEKGLLKKQNTENTVSTPSLMPQHESPRPSILSEQAGPEQNAKEEIINSRIKAFDALGKIAAFFHQTEPHNPVAYLIDTAVVLGGLSLSDWIVDEKLVGYLKNTLEAAKAVKKG